MFIHLMEKGQIPKETNEAKCWSEEMDVGLDSAGRVVTSTSPASVPCCGRRLAAEVEW